MTVPCLVTIGCSLGGLRALQVVLEALPADLPGALAIVQHRAVDSGPLVPLLQMSCKLPVSEANDKDPIAPATVVLAPPDYHLLVELDRHFALSTAAPEKHARPSIDVLFESAAEAFGAQVVGVVLTGANEDGAAGLARIKAAGGLAVVQDPATAEGGTMPAAALAATTVDHVLVLEQIGPLLVRLLQDFETRG